MRYGTYGIQRDGGEMIEVDLKQAEGHLEELIEQTNAGQDVVIVGTDGLTVRLVPVTPEERLQHSAATPIGSSLDRHMGTWSAEQAAELLQSIEVFEQIDPSFWQ
jgi:antitoxin (DNA-binding transcriptional repressor) of toxin-antitoxin stability system